MFQTRAIFPDTSMEFRELIFFRSWQAAGAVKLFYYLALVSSVVLFISTIVAYTILHGAGGFFWGFFVGLLSALGLILAARVSAEVVLSIFEMRDFLDVVRRNGSGSATPLASTVPYQSSEPLPYQQQPQAYQQI